MSLKASVSKMQLSVSFGSSLTRETLGYNARHNTHHTPLTNKSVLLYAPYGKSPMSPNTEGCRIKQNELQLRDFFL